MTTYTLAKAHQNQILREAKQDQLIKAARRAKRKAGEKRPSPAGTWIARRPPTA